MASERNAVATHAGAEGQCNAMRSSPVLFKPSSRSLPVTDSSSYSHSPELAMALIARSSLRAPTLASRQRTVARPSRIVYVRSTAGKSLDSAVAVSETLHRNYETTGPFSIRCTDTWHAFAGTAVYKQHVLRSDPARRGGARAATPPLMPLFLPP